MQTKYWSNDATTQTKLVVYKDWTTEGRGRWRLFWADAEDEWQGCHEQSTVTGQPFFRTRKDAISYGERRYDEKATTAIFHIS